MTPRKQPINRICWMVLFLFGIFSVVLLSGCDSMNTEIGNPESSSLYAFSTDSEVETYLRDQHSQVIASAGADSGEIISSPLNDENIPVYVDNDMGGGSVGEPSDALQSPGNYLYEAADRQVNILLADKSGIMETIAVIQTDGEVEALHLYQEQLIIFQTLENQNASADSGNYSGAVTGMLIVDVSRPEEPEILHEFQIEGAFQTSFTTDGRLYLIQHYLPDLPLFNSDSKTSDAAVLADDSQTFLNGLSFEALIPDYTAIDADGNHLLMEPLVTSDRIFRPKEPTGGKITSVTAFDMENLQIRPDSIAFIGNVQSIRISPSAVYLTDDAPDSCDCALTYKIDISGSIMLFSAEEETT